MNNFDNLYLLWVSSEVLIDIQTDLLTIGYIYHIFSKSDILKILENIIILTTPPPPHTHICLSISHISTSSWYYLKYRINNLIAIPKVSLCHTSFSQQLPS